MTPDVRRASASADNLPYRYRDEAIDLGVSVFSLDEGDPGEPDYDDRSVPLYKYSPWDEASISVSLTINEEDVSYLFDGDPPYDAKLIVAVDSEVTQIRYEVVVAEAPFAGGTHKETVTLNRDLFRGTISLKPRLVRTEDSATGLPYAPRDGMRVAGGESWEVHVDEPEESGKGFPFVYRDFSEGGFSEDAMHELGPNPGDPKVLVNKCHDPIVDVLQTETFYSFDAYLKKIIKAEVGTITWMQLVVHTATTIAEADEPEFPWQEGVVEEISPYLYEDDPSYETAVERLGEAVSEPGELRTFVRELSVSVQLYLDQADQLNKFIEEFA